NRRPVDFGRRQALLRELKEAAGRNGEELVPLTRELLANLPDGRIKLYLTWRLLSFRRDHARLFEEGDYQPLENHGAKNEHVVAFRRAIAEEAIVALAPRLMVELTAGTEVPPVGEGIWTDTWLLFPQAERAPPY